MVEKKDEVKKEVKEAKTLVVTQLPQQAVRRADDDKGNEFVLLTTDEALTEILEISRQLKKGLL